MGHFNPLHNKPLHLFCSLLVFNPHPRICLLIFEREQGGESEREREIEMEIEIEIERERDIDVKEKHQ